MELLYTLRNRCKKGSHFLIMSLSSTAVLLDHIANYLLFLFDAPLFWFTLNTSYDHPHPLVLLLYSHCTALLLSHLTSWLLHCLSLHRPLVVLSLRRSLIVLHWLIVALPLVAPPSCPLVVPPSRPLIDLSLRCPLIVSLHQLIVELPPVAPPYCHPLTVLPSHCLALAGCCIASRCAALLSSRRATPLSSLRPLTVPPSCCLISPAGCCVASCCTALSSSSHSATLSSSCAGWLLHQLLACRTLVLSLCRPLVLLSPSHCTALLLSHCAG
jgi:hypothetical protein